MKISDQKLDQIIDLFCVVGDCKSKDNSVWGMDTELFETRKDARDAISNILKMKLQNCHDCNAKPGEIHKDGCDVEQCSVCGNQRLCCDCKGHDKRFARWTGIWPGKAKADFLGMDLNDFYISMRSLFFIKPPLK